MNSVAGHRTRRARGPSGRAGLVATFLLSVAACFPPVIRGPQIEDGFSAGATIGGTAGQVTYPVGDWGGNRLRNAVKGVFLGYGRSPDEQTSFGGYGAVVIPSMQLDAYAQLPPGWTGKFAGGVGVVLDPRSQTPYVQFGRTSTAGNGWWVGLGHGWYRPGRHGYETTSTAGLGTAAVQLTHGGLRTQLWVQGASGRVPGYCSTPSGQEERECVRGERGRAVSVGLTVGWQQRSEEP